MTNTPTQAEFRQGYIWERPTAEVVAAKLWPGARVVENPAFSHIDLCMVGPDNKVLCQLEVKRRFIPHDRYPTTKVLWEKHDAGRFYKKFFNASVYCVVVFDDRVGFFRLEDKPVGKEFTGRRDRPGSERWYALYSLEQFEWLDNSLLDIINARVESITQKLTPPDLGTIPGI